MTHLSLSSSSWYNLVFTSFMTHDSHWIKNNCLEQWVEWAVSVNIRENSQPRKHETSPYNTATLTQPRPNTAAPLHQDTAACEKVANSTITSSNIPTDIIKITPFIVCVCVCVRVYVYCVCVCMECVCVCVCVVSVCVYVWYMCMRVKMHSRQGMEQSVCWQSLVV